MATTHFSTIFEHDPEPFRTFVNRRHELDAISYTFFVKRNRVVAVLGPRGQGRTSLTRKFAYDNSEQFDGIFNLKVNDFHALERLFFSEDEFDPAILQHMARSRQSATLFMTSDFELFRVLHATSRAFSELCDHIAYNPGLRSLLIFDSVDGQPGDAVERVVGRLMNILPRSKTLLIGLSNFRASIVDEYLSLGPLDADALQQAALRHFGVALDGLMLQLVFQRAHERSSRWRE